MNEQSNFNNRLYGLAYFIQQWLLIRRKVLWFCLAVAGAYILVFTTVWSYWTDLAIHGMFEIATYEQNDPDFRDYVKHSKLLSNLCDASNWVAKKTRPIVSDEVLVALWEAKHVEWEEIVQSSSKEAIYYEKNNSTLGHSLGLDYIYNISKVKLYPDEPIVVGPLKEYGLRRSARACKGEGGYVSKYILYYSNIKPIIYEGRVMRPSDFEFYMETRNRDQSPHLPGRPLIENTDISMLGEFEIWRKLNDRWYLVHQNLQD